MSEPEEKESLTVHTLHLVREEWTAPLRLENEQLRRALSELLEAAFVRGQLAFKSADGIPMDMPARAQAALRRARTVLESPRNRS
jgi:regulator of replication initiation timing